jgi:hypothetical protein
MKRTPTSQSEFKRRKANSHDSTLNSFDEVIISHICPFLNLLDLSRCSALNTKWYQISSVTWKQHIHQVLFSSHDESNCLLNLSNQELETIKVQFASKQMYEQFIQNPGKNYSLATLKAVMQFVDHGRYKFEISEYVIVNFDQHPPDPAPEKVNNKELKKLCDNLIIGQTKYKRVHTLARTNSDAISVHNLINFALYNPENQNIVSFKGKFMYQVNNSFMSQDELSSMGEFQVLAKLHYPSGKVECIDMFKLLSNRQVVNYDSDDDEKTLDPSELLFARLSNNIFSIRILDNNGITRIAELLNVSDRNSLLSTIMCLLGEGLPENAFKYFTHNPSLAYNPEYTMEQQITSSDQPMLMYEYVSGLYNKKFAMKCLKEGTSMFDENHCPSNGWVDTSSAANYELMNLFNNIVTFRIGLERAGEAPDVGYTVDNLSTIHIKSIVNASQVFTLSISGSGWGYDNNSYDEIRDFTFTIWFNGTVIASQSEQNTIQFNKSSVEDVLNLLGCKHLTLCDFSDFVMVCSGMSLWYSRNTNDPTYLFNYEGFTKWVKLTVPDIEKYQLTW